MPPKPPAEPAKPEPTKCDIFTDRRAFLIASVADDRKPFQAKSEEFDKTVEYFGLAVSEHQFRLALCDSFFEDVKQVAKKDMQAMVNQAWVETTK